MMVGFQDNIYFRHIFVQTIPWRVSSPLHVFNYLPSVLEVTKPPEKLNPSLGIIFVSGVLLNQSNIIYSRRFCPGKNKLLSFRAALATFSTMIQTQKQLLRHEWFGSDCCLVRSLAKNRHKFHFRLVLC